MEKKEETKINEEFVNRLCLKNFKKEPIKIKKFESLNRYVYLLIFSDNEKKIIKCDSAVTELIISFGLKNYQEIFTENNFFKKIIYFENYKFLLSDYIENDKITTQQIREKKNRILIIKRISEFHLKFKKKKKEDLYILKIWKNWEKKLFSALEKNFSDSKEKRDEVFLIMTKIKEYIEKLKKYDFKENLVMCHNDLHNNNILFDKINKKFHFIDFEDSNYSYFFTDIYSLINESLFESDISDTDFSYYPEKMPNSEEIEKYLKFYFFYQKFGKENYFGKKDVFEEVEEIEKSEEFKNFKVYDYLEDFYFLAAINDITWIMWAFYVVKRKNPFNYYKWGICKWKCFCNMMENYERIREIKRKTNK